MLSDLRSGLFVPTSRARYGVAHPDERASVGAAEISIRLGGTQSLVRLQQLSSDFALILTATAVLSLFAVSAVTLEYFGLAYITPGGSALSKVHPATPLAILALIFRCLGGRRPLRTIWGLLTGDWGVITLTIAVAITGIYALIISKTPVTPLVDTFVLPILVLVLLRDLHPALLKWLALLVVAIFCANAAVAIYEFLRASHLVHLSVPDGVSPDPTRSDVIFDWRAQLMLDWRATALFGHPLANGVAVCGFILCLLAPGSRWLPLAFKAPVILLQAASMFTFGARMSLAMTVLFASILILQGCITALHSGRRLMPRDVAFGLVGLVVVIAAACVLYDVGFFDRTFERFVSDSGSARTRATMLQLFQLFNWTELISGPNQEVVETWQRLYGLEFGIESSWVGLVLTYGLLVTSFVVLGLAAFSRSVIRACGSGAWMVLLAYFVTVSGAATLSGKTTTLAMTVALVCLFLQTDDRRRPFRSMLRVKTE